MAPKRLPVAAALGALAVLAAGCGSSSSSSSKTTTTSAAVPASGSAHVLKLSADPSGALKFTTAKLSTKAGTVTIRMTNPSMVGHSIAVEGNGVDKAASQGPVSAGQTATVTATLKPGTYTFYCPVDGHKAAGMKGTLTVA